MKHNLWLGFLLLGACEVKPGGALDLVTHIPGSGLILTVVTRGGASEVLAHCPEGNTLIGGGCDCLNGVVRANVQLRYEEEWVWGCACVPEEWTSPTTPDAVAQAFCVKSDE